MDRVRNLLEPEDSREFSRRVVVLSLATGFSGCSGLTESSNRSSGGGGGSTGSATSSATDSPTDTATATESDTPTDTETESETPEPAEGYVNLQPTDPDAAYSDHSVYEELDGEVNVELDLHQAWIDQHFTKPENIRASDKITELINNIHKPEWR